MKKKIRFYLTTLMTLLSTGVQSQDILRSEYPCFSQDYYIMTSDEGVVPVSGALIDSVKMEDGFIRFYRDNNITFSKSMAKVTGVKFDYITTPYDVILFSSEAPDFPAINILDNDLNTFWHSKYGGGEPQLPHWLILDLGEICNLDKIELYRPSGDTKSIQLSVSNNSNPDGDWTAIGIVEYPADAADKLKTLNLDAGVNTNNRYLKLYFSDSWRSPYVNLSEIYIHVRE
jgi:hypothetical protein